MKLNEDKNINVKNNGRDECITSLQSISESEKAVKKFSQIGKILNLKNIFNIKKENSPITTYDLQKNGLIKDMLDNFIFLKTPKNPFFHWETKSDKFIALKAIQAMYERKQQGRHGIKIYEGE